MKFKPDRNMSAIGRLVHWCEVPSPPFSLAVGATCGCDLSQIERKVCRCVNEATHHLGDEFGFFDYEDIRHIAGDPFARRLLVDCANLHGDEYDVWNDYELAQRALASLGGVVLCGQGAIDATRGLDNVCDIMISECEECDDTEISGWINPDVPGSNSVVASIAGHFLDWLSEPNRQHASQRRAMGIPDELVAV